MTDRFDNLAQNNDKIKLEKNQNDKVSYTIDFVTSSAISKIGIKFLLLYIPILWISGYMAVSVFFDMSLMLYNLTNTWIITMFLLPFWLTILYFIFVFGIAFFTKLFIVIINMVHQPKEGVFRATKGNQDYEFWRLRIELKKLVLWTMSNSPLPWIVMWGFRWFGVKIDFSSHLQDSWVDCEFIEFGRNVTCGQGAVVMSSAIIGKYLIIKKVILDDYTVIGGVSNLSPGTIVQKEAILGAFTTTVFNQLIEQGWVYLANPARKLKPNKYAEERRDIIYEKHVDEDVRIEVKQEVNIDEDKKDFLNNHQEE